MSEYISVAGLVATTPRHLVTPDGLPITSFRLASSHRRYDRAQERWVDAETNWFTVTAFRQLAINSSQSISKGERIVLTGRLRVRDWDNGERSGTSVEIEADAIGHDQSWGTSQFVRTVLQKESEAETEAIEEVEASAQVSSDTPDAPESRRRAVPQPA